VSLEIKEGGNIMARDITLDALVSALKLADDSMKKWETIRAVFPIGWHDEVLKWIADSKGGEGSAGVISTHLELIDDFFKTVVDPVFLLRHRFEEMKKKYSVNRGHTAHDESPVAMVKRLWWLETHKRVTSKL
jgi:hypothetical protein